MVDMLAALTAVYNYKHMLYCFCKAAELSPGAKSISNNIQLVRASEGKCVSFSVLVLKYVSAHRHVCIVKENW